MKKRVKRRSLHTETWDMLISGDQENEEDLAKKKNLVRSD